MSLRVDCNIGGAVDGTAGGDATTVAIPCPPLPAARAEVVAATRDGASVEDGGAAPGRQVDLEDAHAQGA